MLIITTIGMTASAARLSREVVINTKVGFKPRQQLVRNRIRPGQSAPELECDAQTLFCSTEFSQCGNSEVFAESSADFFDAKFGASMSR